MAKSKIDKKKIAKRTTSTNNSSLKRLLREIDTWDEKDDKPQVIRNGNTFQTTCPTCSQLPWQFLAIQRCLCGGFNLDLGCGQNKQPGYVGMDVRDVEGVDIVWDIESVMNPPFYARQLGAHAEPWPFKDETADMILASHILEHLDPRGMIDIFNEMWRICKPKSQVMIGVPHGLSSGFIQDPTHKKQFNEATFRYFDPTNTVLYPIYKPKPWVIVNMNSHPMYNMEVVMMPIKTEGKHEAETKEPNR